MTRLKTFAELELIDAVQRSLVEENYHTPTPIQSQTIPAALEGRDILGCAQTGTGKTAAFALPILSQLGERRRRVAANSPLVLVLAPTRELAIQIDESFAVYGRHLRLRQALVYGGVKQGRQVQELDRGAHILVATPGRLLDLMNQGHVDLQSLEFFVLDEADRMLDMGFLPDLKRIIQHLPRRRQSLFFSATLPPKIIELTQRLLTDPVHVNVTPKTSSVERIEQKVFLLEKNQKLGKLQQILKAQDVERAIVFTRTKRGANLVADKLGRQGIHALAIHGNKSQNARQKALDAFRQKKVTVLVATDLAARGIDIDGVTHVINYEIPLEPESYVHRIGRTGRAGAAGVAISFCSSAEHNDLRAIEKLINLKIPTVRERAENQTEASDDNRASGRTGNRAGGRDSGRAGGRANAPAGSRTGARPNPRGGSRSAAGARPAARGTVGRIDKGRADEGRVNEGRAEGNRTGRATAAGGRTGRTRSGAGVERSANPRGRNARPEDAAGSNSEFSRNQGHRSGGAEASPAGSSRPRAENYQQSNAAPRRKKKRPE